MMAQLRQFSTALFALVVCVSLSACGATVAPQPTSFVGYSIPKPLLTCANAPTRLEGDFSQKDVAVYIVKLRAAWADCFGNVGSINQIVVNQETELLAQAKK